MDIMKIQDLSNRLPGWQPTITELADFLWSQPLGVLSTVGPNGEPEAAAVAFSENDRLELVFGTADASRKALNIAEDTRVAFTVTDPDKRYTVQLKGIAHRLTDEEFAERADVHFAKLPASLPFRGLPGQAYFVVVPTFVKFSDCNPHPWEITEFDMAS
jgi:hypothetical protein